MHTYFFEAHFPPFIGIVVDCELFSVGNFSFRLSFYWRTNCCSNFELSLARMVTFHDLSQDVPALTLDTYTLSPRYPSPWFHRYDLQDIHLLLTF